MSFERLSTEFFLTFRSSLAVSLSMEREVDVTVTSNFFSLQLPDEQKAQLKTQILLCVQNEPNKGVRKKCADLAAEVARNLTDDDGNNLWPEFLKVIKIKNPY